MRGGWKQAKPAGERPLDGRASVRSPSTPCTALPTPGLCRLEINPRLLHPGDDEEFADMLDETLGNKPHLSDTDWEVNLQEYSAS
jgi:hypothetical protein